MKKNNGSLIKTLLISAPTLFILWVIMSMICHAASTLFIIAVIKIRDIPVIGWYLTYFFSDSGALDPEFNIAWISLVLISALSRPLMEKILLFIKNTIPTMVVKIFIFFSVVFFVALPLFLNLPSVGGFIGMAELYLSIAISSYLMLNRAKIIQSDSAD